MTVLEYTGARKLPPPKVEATPRPQPRRVALRPILRRRTISIPPSAGAGLSVASVVFFVFFRTGSFLASGDVSPMLTDGLRSELGWQWTHQNTGAGGPTYEIARAVEVLFSAIARVLGGTDALGQRLLFSATWGMVAAAGAALAMRFTRCRGKLQLLGKHLPRLNHFAVAQEQTPQRHPRPGPLGSNGS